MPSGSTTSPPPDTHVAVVDFRFDPATVPSRRGGTVVFDFVGPSHHTATDSSGLRPLRLRVGGPGRAEHVVHVRGRRHLLVRLHPAPGHGRPGRGSDAGRSAFRRRARAFTVDLGGRGRIRRPRLRRAAPTSGQRCGSPGARASRSRSDDFTARRREGPLPVPGAHARRRRSARHRAGRRRSRSASAESASTHAAVRRRAAVASMRRPGRGTAHPTGEMPWLASRWAPSSIRS